MTSPPVNNERRTRELLEQLLPEKPRRRILLAAVGTVASLSVGTYGVNFMLGPLNLGVLEFLWGALLAVGGLAGTVTSVAILISALLTAASERSADDGRKTDDDPVESLKRRYAEGDIDDQEFEQRLDKLLQRPDDAETRDWTETEDEFADREPETAYDR